MKYSDLHIHSLYSDGLLSPEDIVNIALKKKLSNISITDHDTLNSQYIIKYAFENLDIIPGVELSSRYKNREIHILGYYIDIYDENLKNCINILKKSRLKRLEEIIYRLNKQDVHINIEDFNKYKKSSVGRGHVAKILVDKGYSANYKDAFMTYLLEGRSAYVERYKFEYKETISIIRKSGGIAVLSHPGKLYNYMEVEQLVKDLKFYGLQGIEVYHPSHSSYQINAFYNLAKKYKLFITGGSDCHGLKGENKELLLGNYGIDEKLVNKLKLYHINKRR
jgi:hypothetical protein